MFLSVRDCLYGLMLASANEAGNALAEHLSGSIEAFTDLANQKALELGCTGSHFANPSGLNNPDHYVTARDMAAIMRAAISNPVFVEIDGARYWKHAPIKRYPDPDDPHNTVYAHHAMIKRMIPATIREHLPKNRLYFSGRKYPGYQCKEKTG